jgi:hypothetical protein
VINVQVSWVSGSHTSDCEELYLLECNVGGSLLNNFDPEDVHTSGMSVDFHQTTRHLFQKMELITYASAYLGFQMFNKSVK